jgi:hypothetical protein
MKGPTQGKRTNGYWHSAIRVAVKIIGNSNHVEDFKLRTPVLAEDMQIYNALAAVYHLKLRRTWLARFWRALH